MSFIDFDPVFTLGAAPADVAAALDAPSINFDAGAIAMHSAEPSLHFKPPASVLETVAAGTVEGIAGKTGGALLTIGSVVFPPLAAVAGANRLAGAVRSLSTRGPGTADHPSRQNPEDVRPPTQAEEIDTGGVPKMASGIFDGLGSFISGATQTATQLGGLVTAVGSIFGGGPSAGPTNAAFVPTAGLPIPIPRGPFPVPRGGGLPVPLPPLGGGGSGVPGQPTFPGTPNLPDIPMDRRGRVVNQQEICRPASRRQIIALWLRHAGYTWKTYYRLIRLVGPEIAAATVGLDLNSTAFVLSHPPRRRGRGISAADLRRTRSTLGKVRRINRLLGTTATRRARK